MRCSPLRILGIALVLSACSDDRSTRGEGTGLLPTGTGLTAADTGGGTASEGGTDGGTGGGDTDTADSGPGSDGGTDETGAGDDGPVPDTPQGTCGMGGTKRQVVQVDMGSPERWYLMGAPDTDEPLPLVLAFHGDEGDPNESTRWIWGNYWEQNNLPFIVVMTKCPGCTSWYMGDTASNAQYVWDVLTDVSSTHNVDVSRVYAVGYSGGSEFLSLHGFEFQDVFAAIQWSCGGNAYGQYTPAPRDDCKVRGRIVIAADDFLWDGAQRLRQRLVDQGHEHEFIEAQCSGHCCHTPEENEGAWAWFQQHTKCGGEVKGTCGELTDLPPESITRTPDALAAPAVPGAEPAPKIAYDARHLERLEDVMDELRNATTDPSITPEDREALYAAARAAYDAANAHARRSGTETELATLYAELRALMRSVDPRR